MTSIFRKINKKTPVKENNIKLHNDIVSLISKSQVLSYIKKLSKFTNVDDKEIIFFFKKNIFCGSEFHSSNNLKSKFRFIRSIFLLPIGIFFFFYIFLKSSKINKDKKKVDLLIDNIESNHELAFYENIISKFGREKIIIRKTNDNVSHKFVESILLKNYKNYNIKFHEILSCLRLLVETFFLSLKINFNFVHLYLKYINEYYYYKTFFNIVLPKIIIMHQHYSSNNIKNFLLKKNGGIVSSSIQKNIQTQGVNGYFIDYDLLFTFSKNTEIENSSSFSNIRRNYPVGSFFMEKRFFLEKNNFLENFDIVYMGAHDLVRNKNDIFNIYDTYKDDYIEQLNWLKNFSLENTDVKIGFKYHSTYNGSMYEKNILDNAKIIFIDHKQNSYKIIKKAKVICSWNSTISLEATALDKPSFFLDPKGRNKVFMDGIINSDQLTIKSYEEFCYKMKYFTKNEHEKNYNDIFCENSANYSEKIVKILKRFNK